MSDSFAPHSSDPLLLSDRKNSLMFGRSMTADADELVLLGLFGPPAIEYLRGAILLARLNERVAREDAIC
jgi:hypothetical protein